MLADLLDSISKRVPYVVINKVITAHQLPTGQGYEKLKAALLALNDDLKQDVTDRLLEFYQQQLLVGEKAVALLKLDEALKEELLGALTFLEVQPSTATDKYPYYLGDDELAEMQGSPELCGVESDDGYLHLVFTSKRYFTERVKVPLERIKEDSEVDYSDYDEIVAVRRRYQQFFDVVSIPFGEGPIELRVDAPGIMPKAEISRSVDQTIKELWRLAKNEGVEIEDSFEKVNVFPLIEKMYSSREGRVCDLGFVTDGGGIKNAKMRRYEDDLRDEAYHKAGCESAVITPFRIAVRWQKKIGDGVFSNPELLIPGRFNQLSASSKENQYHYVVKRCTNTDDFQFVMEKIRPHIN
ncbi:hypothetical protein [Marinobacter sp. SS21]|uniref:hypothetical protein n=1 Tax=Marinobacter sp. SS21 TaxID=2979460 RepID=UPI00232C1C8F|nr:hypothetical protein [Marinobacter sp. SS21]MDC0664369.1 hypothetical protein [Marinobacter sp. SS21]